MNKKILLSTILLASVSALNAKTVVLDMHTEKSISVVDGCAGDGKLSIVNISRYDRDVDYSKVGDGVYDVFSKDVYRNWNMDHSDDEYKKEGTWNIIDDTYQLKFVPNPLFTKSPSEVEFEIKGDSICGNVKDTFYINYYDGNHFNDLRLPAGAILDEVEYIQSSPERVELLKNDINSKNAKGIVFVESSYDRTVGYRCHPDNIYARTVDGNTTEDIDGNTRRIFASRNEIFNGLKIPDTEVTKDTLNLTVAERSRFYSTKDKYNQKPGIWKINKDLSLNFVEKFRNTAVIRLYLGKQRDISTIGYMSYDKYGNFGNCNVLLLHPKGLRSQKIYLDEHKRENVTINVLDLNESVQKQAHAAVIQESLKFHPSSEKILSVPNEGTWIIDENNLVIFKPLNTFKFRQKNPSEVKLKYDVNRDGQVDYLNYPTIKLFYPIRANYDRAEVDVSDDREISPLSNDTGDLKVNTLRLVSLDTYISKRDGKYFEESENENDTDMVERTIEKTDREKNLNIQIASDGKDAYSSEGHWKVVDDKIKFYRDRNFKGKPSRIGYSIKDVHSTLDYGLIDFQLSRTLIKFKPFYDVNKNGTRDNHEDYVKNMKITIKNKVTGKTISDNTLLTTGILEKVLEIGTYEYSLEVNENLYNKIENETSGEFTLRKNETIQLYIPLKRKTAVLDVKICADNNQNNVCDSGDTLLKNTVFKINNSDKFTLLENGVESIIDVKTSNLGEFKREANYGEYVISYNSVEKKILVSESNSSIDLIIPKEDIGNGNDDGNNGNSGNDGLIDSESSVPSLHFIGYILLIISFLIVVRKDLELEQ